MSTSAILKQEVALPEISRDELERFSRDRNEPDWLRDARSKALESAIKLAVETSPLFQKYSDLSGVNFKEYEYLSYNGRPSSVDLEKFGNPQVVIYPGFAVVRPAEEQRKDGVIIDTLHSALESEPELVEQVFKSKAVGYRDDKFAALNDALFETAVIVRVPKGLVLSDPIRVIKLTGDSAKPVMTQLIVHLEEGSSATIIEEGYSMSDGASKPLICEVTDVYASAGSNLAYSSFAGYSDTARLFSNRKALIGRDAQVRWTFAYMGGEFTRGRGESVFTAPGGSADDIEVLFGDLDQRFDMASDLRFDSTNSTGAVYVRAALKDRARSLNRGLVNIAEDAKRSSAYMSIHSMLFSKNAMADAIPALEIYNNDVKATHSAAVEQIDEERLFYLLSRGLSEEGAKRLMVLAFFEKALERIPSPNLRVKIRELVLKKWGGAEGSWSGDEDLFEWALKFGRAEKSTEDMFSGHYKYRKTVEGS